MKHKSTGKHRRPDVEAVLPAAPWPGGEPERLERERIPLRERFAFALGLRRDRQDDLEEDPYGPVEPEDPRGVPGFGWERELAAEADADYGAQLLEQQLAEQPGGRPRDELDARIDAACAALDAIVNEGLVQDAQPGPWQPAAAPREGRVVDPALKPAAAEGLAPAAGPDPLEPLTRARFRPATRALEPPYLTPGLSIEDELARLEAWIWRDNERTSQQVTAASAAVGQSIAALFPHPPQSTAAALALAARGVAVAEQVRRARGRRPAGALALEARRAGSTSFVRTESRELVSA